MKNDAGVVCSHEEEISNILITFYQNLFNSTSLSNLDEVLVTVPMVIIDDQNALLTIEFVKAEVEKH